MTDILVWCFLPGKFGLGSGRKKDKPKQKVVPDMFAKGALVWEVQVEDMGTASQVWIKDSSTVVMVIV